jgi:hypothetical protein
MHTDVTDICASRKTVETVLSSQPSLLTAINRGVNEKVAFKAFDHVLSSVFEPGLPCC